MRVRSTKKPSPITMDDKNVYINTNIVERDIEGLHLYIYNQRIYDKDEYIAMLSSELTNMQLALVEIYEGGIQNNG